MIVKPRWQILVFSMIGIFTMSSGFSTSEAHDDNERNVVSADVPNSIELIINDMKLAHEGKPHGVPTYYDWALQPRLNRGNNPKNFTAMTAWGQVYEDSTGNPAHNTRVQLRNMKAYMLSKRDNRWHILQSIGKIKGGAFPEDFDGNSNQAADIRQEGTESISVTAGEGDNFHFWPDGRASIDPTDVGGIYITVQARLIINDLNQPDDRTSARYLVNVGGDYWDNGTTNSDIGIGRFRYVKIGWQSFNMCTLSENEVRKNPPPLE